MNEMVLGFWGIASLLSVVVYATLWMIGGRDGTSKSIRRWLGSSVFVALQIAIYYTMGNYNHYLWLMMPILIVFSSRGYGGDTIKEKLLRRSLFSLGMLLACLVPTIIFKEFTLLICAGIVASVSIIIGIDNPISAAAEEVLVCTLHIVVLAMYPFVTNY